MLIALVAVACEAWGSAKREEPSARTPSVALPANPELRHGQLSNGLRYLLLPAEGEEGYVQVGVVVRAGALAETDQQVGVAHLLEHLLVHPTQRFAPEMTNASLRSSGLRLAEGINGFTHRDYTVYRLAVSEGDLTRALRVLAGWMGSAQLTGELVEREREVVIRELREEAAKGTYAARQLLTAPTSLSARPPIGNEASVRHVSVEQVRSFYERWYHPENMVVIAAGPFDSDLAIARVKEAFGALAPAPRAQAARSNAAQSDAPGLRVPASKAWLLSNGESTRSSQSTISRLHLARGGTITSERDYAEVLIDEALCTLLRTRLESPNVACGVVDEVRGARRWGLAAWNRGLPLGQLVSNVEAELALAAGAGHSTEERAEAAARVVEALKRDVLAPERAEAAFDRLERQAAFGHAVLSPSQEAHLAARLLSSAKREDWVGRARHWLVDGRQLIVASGPSGDPTVPDEASLGKLLKNVTPAEAKPVPAPTTLAPEPGTIVAEEPVKELGATRWSLANGARVTFKRLDAGEAREAELRVVEPKPAGNRRLLFQAKRMVPQWGAGSWSASTLARERAAGNIRLIFLPIRSSFPPGELETVLRHLHLQLAAPRASASSPTNLEQIGSPEVLLQAYRAHYGNVAGFSFHLVGNVAIERVRDLVLRYLASLPGSGRVVEVAPVEKPKPGPRNAATGIERRTIQRSDSADSQVSFTFTGSEPMSWREKLELELLERHAYHRLMDQLRHRLGGVLGVRAWSRASESGYSLDFSFDCAPDRANVLKKAALRVLGDLGGTAATPEELVTLRAAFRRTMGKRLQQPRTWLEELVRVETSGSVPHPLLQLPEWATTVNASQLQRIARRYVTLGHYRETLAAPVVTSANDTLGSQSARELSRSR